MARVSLMAVFAVCTAFFTVNAYCQNSPGSLPADPMALMTLAHEKNGLIGADVKPWHMHGTYHAYKDGKPEYEGTYEEWWFSPTRYKISFVNPKQTQTDYATGAALLRDGTQEWLSGPEELLRASVVDPLPNPLLLKQFTLVHRELEVGKEKIECVSLTYPVASNLQWNYPTECFGTSLPVLRLFEHGNQRIVHNQLIFFQGHFIAKNIQVWNRDQLLADLQLDQIETLKQSPETLITPPSSALPVDLTRIHFESSKAEWPCLLKKAMPKYPEIAKDRMISGEVTIEATIGADGHVENPEAVNGPLELRAASLDSVRQWIYRPLDVMGKRTPVDIQIHVIFSIGG